MKRYHEPKLIGSLATDIEKIDLSPDYQRNEVWTPKQKQLLADTVFRGFDIPVIYTRIVNHDKYEVEVADGKQRIAALIDFINNKIKLPDDEEIICKEENIAGKKFKDLTDEQKKIFENYTLNIIKLDATEQEIRQMFKRFQKGTPLKNQEIRNAMLSKIRDEVREIAEHLFFESVAFKNTRMNHDELAAIFMVLEQNKGEDKIKQDAIDFMYENYDQTGLPEVQEKVMRVLDFMQNAFPDKEEFENKSLLKKTTLTSLYLLVSELVDKHGEVEIDKYINDFGTWFQIFDKEKEEQRKLNEDKQEKDMKKYIELISNNTSSPESIVGRKEILMRKWEGYLKQLEKEKKKEQEKESKKSAKQNKNKTDTEKQNDTLENTSRTVENNEQSEIHQQEISA